MASIYAALVMLFAPLPEPECSTRMDAFSCHTYGEPYTMTPEGTRWFLDNCDPTTGDPVDPPCED